jgi:hypothetical protein
MGRYGFVSPGAMAGNAIQEFLMQRALHERQAMLDQQNQQERARNNEQQDRGLGLQERQLALSQQQEARVAEAQAHAEKDAENQRQFSRATTISENAMPGDQADEQTRALLTAQGYGGQLKKMPGIYAQGALESTDENNIPTYGVIEQAPESYQMRGGSKYLAARTAADERAAEGEKNRDAATERADSDRQTRELIARMSASGSAETRALANELKRIQITTAQDKLDATQKTRTDAASAVSGGRSEVRDLAQSLLDDPELSGITGPVQGRRDTFFTGTAVDAKKRLDQLVGKLSLESRGKMKGQGQISDFEGRLLANAVSAIDRAAGPEIVKKHLQAVVDAFKGDAPSDGATSGAPPAKSSFRVVGVR